MVATPRTSELASAADISPSYASEILSGKRDRKPPRSLAIHIYRKTGWKHAILDGLTDEQIDMLEQVEPWSPRKPADQQAAA